MSLFQLSGYRNLRNASVHSVSKVTGFSRQQIIDILFSSGFNLLDIQFNKLNEAHLEVLAIEYTRAIKSYHKNILKRFNELKPQEKKDFNVFFSKFNRSRTRFWNTVDFSFGDEVTFPTKLDDKAIKEFFYDLVCEIDFQNFGSLKIEAVEDSEIFENAFSRIRHKIKLRYVKVSKVLDFRSLVCSFIIGGHYYIFSDEEDNSIEVLLKNSFSRLSMIKREALNQINILKFQIKWKTLNTLYGKLNKATYQIQISNYY